MEPELVMTARMVVLCGACCKLLELLELLAVVRLLMVPMATMSKAMMVVAIQKEGRRHNVILEDELWLRSVMYTLLMYCSESSTIIV